MRYHIEHLPMTISMGVQSENNAEAVEFDVSDWLARDGSLSFSVWVTRPGETEAYQAANATLKDGVLYWWPTGADTAIAGEGRVEILAVSANRRMLSGWTATSIRETTTETTTEAPVDQRPWLDQALLARDEAKAAAASAAASADQAESVVKKEIATLAQELANTAPAIIPTATGSIVSITDGAARPAVEVISHIEPVQAGSGDANPNNVRPISGWDKADAYARGKNIFDTSPTGAQCIGSYYVNASNYDYVISEYENTYAYRVNVQSGKEYIVTTSASKWHTNVRFEDAEQRLVGGLDYPNLKNATIEIPAQAACMVVSIEKTDMTVNTYQIELGNTATAYEPYQDKNLSATLPEPVYGGKLNWTTGKLLSDGVVVDGGSLNWVHWYANMFYAIAPNNDTVRNVLCEVYPKGRELAENGVFTMPTAHTSIYIRDDTLTDGAAGAAELKQKLSGHKIFYQKESPVEYQLTPQQISTLQGINNVWSSTGDTTLSYVADTMLYIDQRISALLNA